MASNFHSDLPNDQLHNPKDFADANSSSVLTKSDAGVLEWNTSPYRTETTMTCSDDVSGGLHHKSFYICWDEANKLQAYFNVAGAGGTFTPTLGFTAMAVDIAPNNTNLNVAAAISGALSRLSAPYNFTTSLSGTGKITFSGMTNSEDTLDYDTNFIIENTKTYTGTTVLTSTQGVLEWLPGGGGGGGAVNDVSAGSPGTSSGTPLTVSPTTGSVVVKSNAYAGTTNVGHVPTGGSSTTFLRGDGTWATPAGSGQAALQVTSGNGIDYTPFYNNNILQVDNTVVRTSGSQNIGGNKTFTSSTFAVKPAVSDNSNRVVTSEWVKDQNYGQGTVTKVTAGNGLTGGDITGQGTIAVDTTAIVTTAGSPQSIPGDKTFNGDVSFGKVPTSVTPPARSNDTSVATTQFVMSELQNVGGGVTSVTATLPLASTGGNTPDISMKRASRTQDGYLDKSDYSVFTAKQDPISLTTTGTGAATLTGTVLNIPAQASAIVGFEQSFNGSINTGKGGNYVKDKSGQAPFLHTSDISGKTGLTSLIMINAGFHVVQRVEDFTGVKGIVEGQGAVVFELHSCLIDCATGQATITKVGDSGVITFSKATCWEIKPATQKKVQFAANTILALSMNVTNNDGLRCSYIAQYISNYK